MTFCFMNPMGPEVEEGKRKKEDGGVGWDVPSLKSASFSLLPPLLLFASSKVSL